MCKSDNVVVVVKPAKYLSTKTSATTTTTQQKEVVKWIFFWSVWHSYALSRGGIVNILVEEEKVKMVIMPNMMFIKRGQ